LSIDAEIGDEGWLVGSAGWVARAKIAAVAAKMPTTKFSIDCPIVQSFLLFLIRREPQTKRMPDANRSPLRKSHSAGIALASIINEATRIIANNTPTASEKYPDRFGLHSDISVCLCALYSSSNVDMICAGLSSAPTDGA